MKGRRPLPTKLKVLLGTAQHTDRTNYREPLPTTNIADASAWLTVEQRLIWSIVVDAAPAGMLKELDRGLLESWVLVEDICRRAARELERQKNLNTKKSIAAVAVLRQFIPIKKSLATELGFSPLARPRIAVTPQPDEKASAFEKLLG